MNWALLIPMLALAIPIVAIVSNAYVKLKLKTAGNQGGKLSDELIKRLKKEIVDLKESKKEVEERLHNLETIVTNEAWSILPPETESPKSIQAKTQTIAEKMKEFSKEKNAG